MEIHINKIINASNAISHSDGLKLYKHLENVGGVDFLLSFEGINRVSTAFLNASIGKMVVEGTFRESMVDRSKTKEIVLKKIDSVIANAKNFHKYNEIVDDATAALC